MLQHKVSVNSANDARVTPLMIASAKKGCVRISFSKLTKLDRNYETSYRERS